MLAFRDATTELSLRGGTHVGFSQTIDFMQVPLRSLLARFGLALEVEVSKRMFSPAAALVVKCGSPSILLDVRRHFKLST